MRVVSLFSGAGGLDLGFLRKGHDIIWANDNFKDAADTYRTNIGDHIVLGDIQNILAPSIPDCDAVVGGFPCQGFSVANTKRHVADTRNQLYLHFLRVVKEKQPRYFLAENVKGLLSIGGGQVLRMILDDFASAGYSVAYNVLNAADFGVPQRRLRVLFIGTRLGEPAVEFPAPTHADPRLATNLGKLPWVSAGESLANLPDPDASGQDAVPNHTYSKYKLRFNGYIGHRRIDPDLPAPTVTARGDDRGGVVVLHHPNNLRRMSARELATIQSFPLDYYFCGCRSSVYRQIANAVPPLLAESLAGVF